MTRISPFLFDQQFDETLSPSPGGRSAGASAKSDFAKELDAARAEGRREGIDQGLRQAAAEREHLTAQSLASIATNIAGLQADFQQHRDQTARQALEAALQTVRVLFPRLYAGTAAAEISALCEQVIAAQATPRLYTISVHPDFQADIERALCVDNRSPADGVDVRVQADPAVKVGDCRIAWPGGGVERTADDLWQHIDEAMAAVLAASSSVREAGNEPRPETE